MNYDLKPQLKVLGPKYGAKLGAIRKYLSECDACAVVDTVNAGNTVSFDADGTEVVLSKEDLLISPISRDGFVSESDGKYTVILDTELTSELQELGLVRELVSKIQSVRKETGFEVTDHISIVLFANDDMNKVFEKYADDIKSSTLADSLVVEDLEGLTNIEINAETVKLKLEKV